ncbi:hypothetical protein CSOJ01_09863 [Colletotrichum sojae]|uniref:Uncharacterized protein n=1 Tax=Colletotrichum sojae TaxID=2175907 RepID=A0A8H6MQV6_9PEZI|nr:hypothetical protein CSOJ01_09863 [Colletotrichum sojae]
MRQSLGIRREDRLAKGPRGLCDNLLVNFLAETVIDLIISAAQLGCFLIMSSLKLVIDIALSAFPPGRAVASTLDALATTAQLFSYLYDKDQDPFGAFKYWLLPCGGSDLVPDEVKKAFEVLNTVTDGISFQTPKKIKKYSGKKGDKHNPKDQDRDRGKPGSGSVNGKNGAKECKIKATDEIKPLGRAKNVIRIQECVKEKTEQHLYTINKVTYAPTATPTNVVKKCSAKWNQACAHYSSAIRVNPEWSTLMCPQEAATASPWRAAGVATLTWSNQHNGAGWRDSSRRAHCLCDRDEYPPASFLSNNDEAVTEGGLNSRGQLVRWSPASHNRGAGSQFSLICFGPHVFNSPGFKKIADFMKSFQDSSKGSNKTPIPSISNKNKNVYEYSGEAVVDVRPEFSWEWDHTRMPEDGLRDNPCWPRGVAASDPGFVLLTNDPYYNNIAPPYRYNEPYQPGQNGGSQSVLTTTCT